MLYIMFDSCFYPCKLSGNHIARHSSIPPTLLSAHSRASQTPRSVSTNRHSPGRVSPLTWPLGRARTRLPSSSGPIHIRLVGFETSLSSDRTGSSFQYFSPSHIRRWAGFFGIDISCGWSEAVYAFHGCSSRLCSSSSRASGDGRVGSGGVGPAT